MFVKPVVRKYSIGLLRPFEASGTSYGMIGA